MRQVIADDIFLEVQLGESQPYGFVLAELHPGKEQVLAGMENCSKRHTSSDNTIKV